MRILGTILLVLCVAAACSFADEGGVTTTTRVIKDFTLESADPDHLTGKVVCVVPAELMRPRAEIVVADQSGSEICFTVKVLAVIYDSKGKMLSLDQLTPGMAVQVNYRQLAHDKQEATSIKVLR